MTLLEQQPGPGLFLFLLVCFAGGYLMAAAVFLCAGSAVETEQEGGLLVTPLVLLLMVPLGLSFPVSQNPDAFSSVVLSLVPCFTPVLLPARALLSDVPAWQIAAGLAGMAALIALEFRIAGRIFARGVLSYARPALLDRWLRWLKLS
jgi:ABC-2 type transport system permease protein